MLLVADGNVFQSVFPYGGRKALSLTPGFILMHDADQWDEDRSWYNGDDEKSKAIR
jgi:hypothetical protein